MNNTNEGFFNLLFRDESPDEGYSLLGIALLASIAFHLFFFTCIKIKTFSINEPPISSLPTLVTFDTSSHIISVVEDEDLDKNSLSPKKFGFKQDLFDEQVPLPKLQSDLFLNLHAIAEIPEHEDITTLINESHCIENLRITNPQPPVYPLQIAYSGELSRLHLIADGSELFSRSYLECLFASPLNANYWSELSFNVTVRGEDGSINDIQPIHHAESERAYPISMEILKRIRFAPCVDKEAFSGTIQLSFSCSDDILNLLTTCGSP